LVISNHTVALELGTGEVVELAFGFFDGTTIGIFVGDFRFSYNAPGISFIDIREIDIMIGINLILFNSNGFILIIKHLFSGISFPDGDN
jgi:hypothetical protein